MVIQLDRKRECRDRRRERRDGPHLSGTCAACFVFTLRRKHRVCFYLNMETFYAALKANGFAMPQLQFDTFMGCLAKN